MRTRIALLLLLTLALSLGLGVHPCDAAEREPPSAKAQAAPAAPFSCHGSAASSPATKEHASHTGESRHDGRGSKPCSDQPCPHLCHATALPAVALPVFTVQAIVAQLAAAHAESVPAAPARSIDHVPLS